MIRYRLLNLDTHGLSERLTLQGVVNRAIQKLIGDGPWQLGDPVENVWGKPSGSRVVLRWNMRRRLRQAKVGDVVGARGRTVHLSIRKVEAEPPITNTEGNSKIDKIYTFVTTRFHVDSAGICNRRYIKGTSPPIWTQHCPWPAPDAGSNAWDIVADFDTMERIVDELVKAGKSKQLPVGKTIFNRRSWTPSDGFRPYDGVDPHTGHIHVEGLPERTGSPRASCP